MLRERRRHASYKPNRRLDRKSSRGMIYENEELRLRTININAEVERGQSDIRKLKRENLQLKREIWELREEYDRLNKLLKLNRNTGGGGSGSGNDGQHQHSHSGSSSQSEDSDSCDTCKGGDNGDDDADEDVIEEEEEDDEDDDEDGLTELRESPEQRQQQENVVKYSSVQQQQQFGGETSTTIGNFNPVTTGNNSSSNNHREIADNYENSQKTFLTNTANSNKHLPALPLQSPTVTFNDCEISIVPLTAAAVASGSSASSLVKKANTLKLNNSSSNIEANTLDTHFISSGTSGASPSLTPTPPFVGTSSSKLRENLHVNFDHLSIVSEENLTCSDGTNSMFQTANEMDAIKNGATGNCGSPLTPLGLQIIDLQKSALAQLGDVQENVPPLSYFENIAYNQIGPPRLLEMTTDELNYSSSTTTGETVVPAGEWNFNMKSSSLAGTSSSSSSSSSMGGILIPAPIPPPPPPPLPLPPPPPPLPLPPPPPLPPSSSSSRIRNDSSHIYLSSPTTGDDEKTKKKSPKHFFSPIKPQISEIVDSLIDDQLSYHQQHNTKTITIRKDKILLNNEGPDIFVSNALASPYPYHHQQQQHQQLHHPQNYSIEDIQKQFPIVLSAGTAVDEISKNNSTGNRDTSSSSFSFQRGGNLEELLSDIQSLSNDILQMQLEKQKSYSQEKLDKTHYHDDDNTIPTERDTTASNRKPFRSEMNLVLTYNGSRPVITPISRKKISSTSCTTGLDLIGTNTSNVINVNANEIHNFSLKDATPPPTLPEPMILFPQNLTYLGIEHYYNNDAGGKSGKLRVAAFPAATLTSPTKSSVTTSAAASSSSSSSTSPTNSATKTAIYLPSLLPPPLLSTPATPQSQLSFLPLTTPPLPPPPPLSQSSSVPLLSTPHLGHCGGGIGFISEQPSNLAALEEISSTTTNSLPPPIGIKNIIPYSPGSGNFFFPDLNGQSRPLVQMTTTTTNVLPELLLSSPEISTNYLNDNNNNNNHNNNYDNSNINGSIGGASLLSNKIKDQQRQEDDQWGNTKIATTSKLNNQNSSLKTEQQPAQKSLLKQEQSCILDSSALITAGSEGMPPPSSVSYEENLDKIRRKLLRTESNTSENANVDAQSSSGSESAKRKSRRVSIFFSSGKKNADKKAANSIKDCKKEGASVGSSSVKEDALGPITTVAASEEILPTGNDSTFKNSSSLTNLTASSSLTTDHHHHHQDRKSLTPVPVHSTPNSPHSGGRHHHHHHHNKSYRKMSQDLLAAAGINVGVDGVKDIPGRGTTGAFGASSTTAVNSNTGTTIASGHHHQHHESSLLVGSNAGHHHHHHHHTGHHGHHGHHHRRESYQDNPGGGTSLSERNSNSLASSRESSTSLSMRSQRRKISISSHNGGKIPWCGCWGNGCV